MSPTLSLPHLLDIDSLTADTIDGLIQQAARWAADKPAKWPSLTNTIVATLFYENSTRTRLSFQLAASHLQAHCIDFTKDTSSVSKGESLQDTAASLVAMGTKILIVRHPHDHTPALLADLFGKQVAVINAGDGKHAHPTQALLDLLTISQYKSDFSKLRVALIGDVKHSRVARSQICGLTKMGVTDIRVIAPNAFLPEDIATWPVNVEQHIEQGLSGVDVVICLRIQKERIPADQFPNQQAYHQQFGLCSKRLALAKPDAIVMHPGPINRGVEITDAVADGSQSVILQQVRNGVFMRMAILATVAKTHPLA